MITIGQLETKMGESSRPLHLAGFPLGMWIHFALSKVGISLVNKGIVVAAMLLHGAVQHSKSS